MINNLVKYKTTMTNFLKYIKATCENPTKLLTDPDPRHHIGYLLSYLETRSIFILCDNFNYTIFTTGTDSVVREKIKASKSEIIKQTTNTKKRGILDLYHEAIDYAFDFIDTPF
jgi:hypothetical protein